MNLRLNGCWITAKCIVVVCGLMNISLNGQGIACLRPPRNFLPIWPMLPLPWPIFWPLREGLARGDTRLFGGGGDVSFLMFSFVCLLLYVVLSL